MNAVVTSAHPDAVAEALPQYFDRVVVDAPCSGEGMFRKDPTAIAEWSPEHVSACAKRQQQILESACRCVAPGGKLIYSTCTFSREENEDVIEEFCRMHPEFTVEMQHRLYPHTCCGEGHFAARLQRNRSSFPGTSAFTASAESACTAQKKAGMRSGRAKRSDCIPDAVAVPRIKDKAEIAALTEFLRDSFLDFSDESRLNEFLHEIRRMSDGRIVYAPFTFHENLLRLRILSLGVEVGELLKGRFKPCHSFFVACHGCTSAMKLIFCWNRMNFADIFPEILYPFRSICAVLLRFLLTAVHSVSARLLTACLRIIFPKDLRLPHFVDAADGAFGNRLFSVRIFVPCDYVLTTN